MKRLRKLLFVYLMVILLAFTACKTGTNEPVVPEECDHHYVVDSKIDATCTEDGLIIYKCDKCGDIKEEIIEATGHKFITEVIEPTCTEYGKIITKCEHCGYVKSVVTQGKPTGHKFIIVIDEESIDGSIGKKHKECEECGMKEEQYSYVNIGYSRYGKLHVSGADLVDKNNNKVQLLGLSTHGLHWYGEYVNEASLLACKEAFNINVFRFSLYTSENGYCECSASKKEELYQRVLNGVKIATKLDMYAIVDWHMLGEENDNDKNPLYYKEEAKEFFDRITKDLADYDNVFYEIMNEPCGPTTWIDCKKYAEEIIPIIRANKPDAIVLVGNPKWSSDLVSPKNNPLSFDNIMYTFHFYAADLTDTSKVSKAYAAGLPIFVTEHGGMDADGDGSVNKTSLNAWYQVLDSLNISYVAWNISHSSGSSAILVSKAKNLDDFSINNLKEWGRIYKTHIRVRLGLN